MADNTIYKIPPVRQEIVNAVNNDKLAIFIGAGTSRIIGCMGWKDLAGNLLNRCLNTKKKDGTSCINFKEKETLSQNDNHKKTITICHHILEQNGCEDIFFEELNKSLDAKPELLQSQNIYNELYGLRGLFITTNADIHFDNIFNAQHILYRKENFSRTNIDRTKLYHIHGSILDKSSLIFKVPEYIQRYNDPQFRAFLETIFSEYTVLFVGYGMEEFELLDFIITKFDPDKGGELKHFILLPFYKGEENILEFEQYYYNSMGITVLAYEKDERGYSQLYEVIKKWNSEINQTSTYLYDSYNEIEKTVNNYDKDKADRIFQMIQNDKPQENYLFGKLASSSDPFPWLKPLRENNYFNSANNPPPQEAPDRKGYFTIPYWNVLGYLENVAIQNTKNLSDEITKNLIEIVDSIISYRDTTGDRIKNYHTDWIIIKVIFTLPIEKVTNEHIEFIGTALKSKWGTILVAAEIGKTVLPKLIDCKSTERILELLGVILDYNKVEGGITDKYTSVIDNYWLNEALKIHKLKISELCGIEAAKVALEKMRNIINEDDSQFNSVWIPAIEDHPQTSFPDRYECQLVHFVRDMYERSNPSDIKEEISSLLKKEHPIFKRIAIHIINYHYDELHELFWNWKGNPLDEHWLKHELYELLKAKCISFSKEQIRKVLGWIESKEYYIPDEIKEDNEQVEKRIAYRKREWLLALLETKDSNVNASYEKYQQINSTEIDHPGFDSWHYGVQVGTISPIEEANLLNKSNAEIAKYLISFKGEEHFGEPSQEGLSDTFRKCVAENPEKFSTDLKPFLKVQRLHQHALLWGLHDAWRSNKDFTWKGILDFISQIIESDDFWNKESGEGRFNYRKMIIGQIANLIEEGTRDDKHAFDEKFLPLAEKILLILAKKTESDLYDMKDLVTSVLNSSKGKIFSAMINYSLRYARLHKKEQEDKWIETIKDDFTKRLDREVESTIEFSVILGEYLQNLYYLDKKWVDNNVNRIFLKDYETHWKAAFTGYLFYSSTVYKKLYFLLKDNNHYDKGLQSEFSDNHIIERLIQHTCVGYIEGWEKLDDELSLISKLIKNNNVNQLSAIVSFFWMLRNKLTDKIKAKVKPLWKVLIQQLSKNQEDIECQKIIADLSNWLCLVDEIDEETVEWLKLSAKYQVEYNTIFFIEYLLQHVEHTPDRVGDIYLEMLESDIYPEYKKEYIQEIVKKLYDQQQKPVADKICNLYGARGYDFLKEIFDNNRGDN
jgi:hypothetical protein